MATSFYHLVRGFVAPATKLYLRPRVTGLENVPEDGAFLIASNHLALLDSFIIPVVCPRGMRFIAKDEYWHRRGPIGWIQKSFFQAIGTVPVDRDTLVSKQGALKAALEILQGGDGFAIYPEGTRSRDGRLYKGRQGAAWLAMEADCPVIPVGLKGTDTVMQKGRLLPARRTLTLRFGTPIRPADIDPSLPGGVRRRMLNDRIMDEIAELSGQERADELNKHSSRDI
ncbi:lysophospholipid acyltransferase family protein [Brachybacterium phenoliresistens]|uniref:Acyl-phosphate glycerol 3-phosphate acyltransferase n=1 Tax=Brachybacterium phenoliresistens TaxID=396014 RepID=Z9JRR6_9MICO|nr:lysophospholipid acyltransferase family protein [Brachybacterium phenoliresistens]EWS81045.1 acyl-phosphate glycerol 3-phosphate acyltransferase [Brachybacterium phenoliresistens]